jgi:hypothetical protein
MPVSDEQLREYYREFLTEAGSEFAKERVEKKETLPGLITEEKVEKFEEGDVRELIRNLWAFRGWTNKDYLVDQVLEDGIENVRTQFRQAFYGTEDVAEKFDVLNENVNMLGPASITELLTFTYPDRCAIYNRRAREALQQLGYDVVDRLDTGEEYIEFIETVELLKERLDDVEEQEGNSEIDDLVDVDYFLFYISNLDIDEDDGKEVSEPLDDFDHEEFKQKLLEIGDGLGFDVEEEYEAGPGARLDVRWKTRVANLGVISYAFEVHRKGSRDSALLNLMKAQNADPTLQKLIIVSTKDEIEKFRDEADAISADLTKSISYFEASQVQRAEARLTDLKDILQDADLMVDL